MSSARFPCPLSYMNCSLGSITFDRESLDSAPKPYSPAPAPTRSHIAPLPLPLHRRSFGRPDTHSDWLGARFTTAHTLLRMPFAHTSSLESALLNGVVPLRHPCTS
jgi:hypothetical protein